MRLQSDGIYCFLPNPEKDPQYNEAVTQWTDAIANALTPEYAATPFGRVANYDSRWETPTFSSYCWMRHKIPCFTIENPYAISGELLLTRECYQKAGKRIASCVVEKLG